MSDLEGAQVWRPSAAINPERLDYLWGLAEKIGQSSIVPESLRGERNGSVFKPFDSEVITANVFAVIEQADRINFSPFALLMGSSIVRGKLMFEGKVVAAILDQNFAVELHQYFIGQSRSDDRRIFLSDRPLPEDEAAKLEPGFKLHGYRIIDGSVGEWKTTGNNSPWRPDRYDAMLVYRGTREFARLHKPAAIMGVIADDEALELAYEHRAQLAKDTTPIGERFAAPAASGFNAENVTKQLENNPSAPVDIFNPKTGEVVETRSGAQPVTTDKQAASGSKATQAATTSDASTATASAAPTDDSAGGAGSTASGGSQPQQNSSADAPRRADDQGGDAHSIASRIPASIWRGYHSALARVATEANVQKAHDAFWSEGKGKGAKVKHADDVKLGVDIKAAHIDRAAGRLEAAYVAKEIDGWIESSAPKDAPL